MAAEPDPQGGDRKKWWAPRVGGGAPLDHGDIESIYDNLRDELFNQEMFSSLHGSRVILQGWHHEYNEERPHSSVGSQTPAEFAGRTPRVPPVGLRHPNVTRGVFDIQNNQNQHQAEL